jgi:N6-adenosine-specific RNA methylase IME4
MIEVGWFRRARTDGSSRTGYWNRNQHELLLLGTKGNIPAPSPGTQFPSVICAPRGRHSEKPEIVYEMIERLFPNLPKIEVFARKTRHSGGPLRVASGCSQPPSHVILPYVVFHSLSSFRP